MRQSIELTQKLIAEQTFFSNKGLSCFAAPALRHHMQYASVRKGQQAVKPIRIKDALSSLGRQLGIPSEQKGQTTEKTDGTHQTHPNTTQPDTTNHEANDKLPIHFLRPQDRVAPSEVLRSALFGIGSRKKREHFTEHLIFAQGETKITYTGRQLDQGDLDVFMAAIKTAYDNDKAFEIKCSLYAFQQALGLTVGKSGRDRIKSSFKRLTAGTITIRNSRYYYSGHLVDSFLLDREKNTYTLRLNPKLSQLFRDGYTRIDWGVRCKLRSDLGRRLQALVLSHKAPITCPQRHTMATLMELCCCADSDERRFKARIRRNMRILEAEGQIRNWTLQRNVLYYTRD